MNTRVDVSLNPNAVKTNAKMQLFSYCYTVILYHAIAKLYISKKSAVFLSDCRVMIICKIS